MGTRDDEEFWSQTSALRENPCSSVFVRSCTSPRFFGPGVHCIVFVLPGSVHGANDAGNVLSVLEPLENFGTVFVVVVVAGEHLFEAEVSEEFAVFPFEPA